jgi:hypothetical protein
MTRNKYKLTDASESGLISESSSSMLKIPRIEFGIHMTLKRHD